MYGDSGFVGGVEIVGDDDELLNALAVSGMGDSEIVGAASPAATRTAQIARARNAAAVIKKGLESRRRYPLGFTPTAVAANSSGTIPAGPQNLFRAERLIVPSDIAFDFGITDIKVGNQSQLAQSVEIPAAMFSEVAIDSRVTFDTAEIGNQIAITVRNKTAGQITFTAALLGTVAK